MALGVLRLWTQQDDNRVLGVYIDKDSGNPFVARKSRQSRKPGTRERKPSAQGPTLIRCRVYMVLYKTWAQVLRERSSFTMLP